MYSIITHNYKLSKAWATIKTQAERNSGNSEFVENVASINVRRTVKDITSRSVILHEMIEKGDIGICGAMYNVETGVVEFYDDPENAMKIIGELNNRVKPGHVVYWPAKVNF